MEPVNTEFEPVEKQESIRKSTHFFWLADLLLILIITIGGYLRFTGIDWALDYHLHPDERFLVWVTTDISPVHSISEYFNTDISSLNPHNRGHGFFVYGTFPIFITRYVAAWMNQTGWGDVTLLGRTISALFDLGTVVVIYAIGRKVFKNRFPALMAAAFYSFSVLPIQLSHYYTVDTAANFFGFLTFYMAVIIYSIEYEVENKDQQKVNLKTWITNNWKSIIPYILFGIFLGMAAASKINAVLLAILVIIPIIPYFFGLISFPFFYRLKETFSKYTFLELIIAALVSFLTFRILQPYAFSGPGFFNFSLNARWIQNLTELANLSSGNNWGFPPAVQWVDRPITFSYQNMVLWGLGIPLGILASFGFLWMGWRIIKNIPRGKPYIYVLLWFWTFIYFTWQSVSHTSSMRYQMLVYPTLALMAGWALWALWEKGNAQTRPGYSKRAVVWKVSSILLAVGVLGATAGWAYAFSRIYNRPITRIEASEWIYQNVPGPINLEIQTNSGSFQQPISYPLGASFSLDSPLSLVFTPNISGSITALNLSHLRETNLTPGITTIWVTILDESQDTPVIVQGNLPGEFTSNSDPRGPSETITFETPLQVIAGESYTLTFHVLEEGFSLSTYGPLSLDIQTNERIEEFALPDPVLLLYPGETYTALFTAQTSGDLNEVLINRLVDWEALEENKTLIVRIIQLPSDGSDPLQNGTILGSSQVVSFFTANDDPRGAPALFSFSEPVHLESGQNYLFALEFQNGKGALALYGSRQAIESSWDDPLPYAMDGYNPFDYYNGLYRTDLNFEMYWEDNEEKLERTTSILDQADYIFISSSRQWGSLSRLPDHYPMTSEFYRALIGCPPEREITWCYSVATPGMFQGQLGYELVQVFQSDPNIGGLRFNTQFAEEAFTVYDHPKVLIFRRTTNYQSEQVYQILSNALTGNAVINEVTSDVPEVTSESLMMPVEMHSIQQEGGTWSELFNTEAIYNRYPLLGALLWYFLITILGWVIYPMLRLAMSGLPDRGYPYNRMVGLLFWALITWLLGSNGIPFSRTTILYSLLGLVAVNILLGFLQGKQIVQEVRERWRYFLKVEAFGLIIFAIFLAIRFGNGDLWHPAKGGEKPMDFSYFNAVLRSTVFPPYDPWFAGGTMNYYYYGFVIAGVPTKFLGIVPSIAYNFILPTFFSMFALGAFSLGSNLFSAGRSVIEGFAETIKKSLFWAAGLLTAIGVLVLGNLGTLRMIVQGLQRLGANGIDLGTGNLFQQFGWFFGGIAQVLGGAGLPYGYGDWYWIPSRVIPGEPITEFPMFTFLYADPHAHLLALPITLTALGWTLSILLMHWHWKTKEQGKIAGWLKFALTFLAGGVILGALRPTNTWDFPTFLTLAGLGIMVAFLQSSKSGAKNAIKKWLRFIPGVTAMLMLVGLSFLLYQPFTQWFHTGYTAFDFWQGDHTPIGSYLTHWGLFLFIILSWEIWEIYDWMATTPASKLEKLIPFRFELFFVLVAYIVALVILLVNGIVIAWIAFPMALFAGLLILRPGQSDVKRFILFLIGTGLILTIVVELIALRGDIGRMNTVFKFYLQAWILLGVSAAAALIWLMEQGLHTWKPKIRNIWQFALIFLVGSAALFPILATSDKIRDRMAPLAPHSLDGMNYMKYAHYSDSGMEMDLSQDYRAIRWMQENVVGSPVIVEANTPEYRWGSRFTIYTGLPGVVGWNWHQRQQRSVANSDVVVERVDAVDTFYTTEDQQVVENFLATYQVRYIIVGQLERAYYGGVGLDKFETLNGALWRDVYRDGDTVIYEVMP